MFTGVYGEFEEQTQDGGKISGSDDLAAITELPANLCLFFFFKLAKALKSI